MTALVLGAIAGVVVFAVIARCAVEIACRVLAAYRGTHRLAGGQQWRMCTGSPRVRRHRPVMSHRRGRVS